ncbi:uncharacterized protein LOC117230696 isoform X3 [Bombus vosnesenskii]|uniref:Uncharacterized protein LOC117230696 isoform X3 n=3 Tax=Pyrobombus TaxID=144703 RepID=A0A6J3JU53_9HYME|nr:uncharacterized protein LOC117157185 isoform X3 [Bombus vancouverensis nearcticus]XP_033299924.1 uncharacterized protein LOC117205536 isoform X3 [Bombus bifarius]XP_033344288.1 uncharacterized protein LOC117230696 isoform X3 [Bombus vosnesenskii]
MTLSNLNMEMTRPPAHLTPTPFLIKFSETVYQTTVPHTSACGERESGAISVNEETPSRVDQQVLFPVQNTFTSMGIAYACSVVAMLAVILLTVEAGDMMRKSIVFDKNTPDVFYCPQQKPTGFQKMIVNAKPLSRLCQFEGKPIPPDYKSDCYNDVDETEYACKEKYRIMKRFRNKAEGDENTVDDYVDK